MSSFNILGDCVSRDMVTPLINNNKATVLQYHAFSNPASLFSEKGKYEIAVEDITTTVDTNFRKRCAVHDINKTAINYVFSSESDYLIVDFLDARLPMLKKDNHLITLSNCIRNCRNLLDIRFDMPSYTEISPFNDIPEDEWKNTIIRICDIIKQHYSADQVILNKHFGVELYVSNGNIQPYTKYLPFIKTFNSLVAKLFDIAENELKGCHIVEFPQNVLGDGNHQWGLYPLHYHELYYKYGARALEIILENDSQQNEQKKLSQLKEVFADKFELMYLRLMQTTHLDQIQSLQKSYDELLTSHVSLKKTLEIHNKKIRSITRRFKYQLKKGAFNHKFKRILYR